MLVMEIIVVVVVVISRRYKVRDEDQGYANNGRWDLDAVSENEGQCLSYLTLRYSFPVWRQGGRKS